MNRKVNFVFTDEDQQIIAKIKKALEKDQGPTSEAVVIRYALRQAAANLGQKKEAGKYSRPLPFGS